MKRHKCIQITHSFLFSLGYLTKYSFDLERATGVVFFDPVMGVDNGSPPAISYTISIPSIVDSSARLYFETIRLADIDGIPPRRTSSCVTR